MARAPFQVLIIPYQKQIDEVTYLILKRSDGNVWQWVSGGGENNESKVEAAKRELYEELNIDAIDIWGLKSMSSIPVYCFNEIMENYPDMLVVSEYSFGVEIKDDFKLSNEHNEYRWVTYQDAISLLTYDSNKTALWELANVIGDKHANKNI